MTIDLAVYQQAADVIKKNGHHKGAYFNPSPETGVGIQLAPAESPACITGALSIAMFGEPGPPCDGGPQWGQYEEAATRLAEAIGLPKSHVFDPVGRLARWNDADERKPEDVIEALENVAKAVA